MVHILNGMLTIFEKLPDKGIDLLSALAPTVIETMVDDAELL